MESYDNAAGEEDNCKPPHEIHLPRKSRFPFLISFCFNDFPGSLEPDQ